MTCHWASLATSRHTPPSTTTLSTRYARKTRPPDDHQAIRPARATAATTRPTRRGGPVWPVPADVGSDSPAPLSADPAEEVTTRIPRRDGLTVHASFPQVDQLLRTRDKA